MVNDDEMINKLYLAQNIGKVLFHFTWVKNLRWDTYLEPTYLNLLIIVPFWYTLPVYQASLVKPRFRNHYILDQI